MTPSPFQIARWALLAGFVVMVLIVSLPNPEPSTSWRIAEAKRYETRFPQRHKGGEATPDATGHQLAGEQQESSAKALGKEGPPMPYRTAQLPIRSKADESRPAASINRQESGKLAPDPKHLEPPR